MSAPGLHRSLETVEDVALEILRCEYDDGRPGLHPGSPTEAAALLALAIMRGVLQHHLPLSVTARLARVVADLADDADTHEGEELAIALEALADALEGQ